MPTRTGKDGRREPPARLNHYQPQIIVELNLRSAMVTPLFDNTTVIGLLYAESDDPRILFDREQFRLFSLLVNLTAVKITTTRAEKPIQLSLHFKAFLQI